MISKEMEEILRKKSEEEQEQIEFDKKKKKHSLTLSEIMNFANKYKDEINPHIKTNKSDEFLACTIRLMNEKQSLSPIQQEIYKRYLNNDL